MSDLFVNFSQTSCNQNMTARHASIGDIPFEVLRSIRRIGDEAVMMQRTQSESDVDPLKRFEYLRNGKATSVMIRATPNAVRWDEINRVQYRFQALNFHSDVLEALIQNSPPLSRREQTAASKTKDKKIPRDLLRNRDDNNNGGLSSDDESDNEDDNNNIPKMKSLPLARQVRALRRTSSCDLKHAIDRKGSVVQLGAKDDTSDYNSDEEVFQGRSVGDLESVNYNATICHVRTGQIKDTTQINVRSYNKHGGLNEEDLRKVNEKNLHVLADPNTYHEGDDLRATSSAPPSTKVSVAGPLDHELVMNEHFRSENDRLNCINDEDLSLKSKEELVELVRSLQRELETTKHHSLLSPTLLQRGSSRRSMSRQDSINEECETDTPSVGHQPVSTLIRNFEQRGNEETLPEPRRSNTLPLKTQKPDS